MEYMESMMQNQYDAQNQLIMELDGTRMERDQLKAERDALAASIAALHRLHSDLTNADMVCDEDENHVGYVIENEQLDEMERLLNEPQQNIAEILAEAAERGYYQGFKDGLAIECPRPDGTNTASPINYQQVAIENAARMRTSQYVAKLRQGAE
jgi:hypothetical protein